MSEISLRAYIKYIEDRLESGAHPEVIAQCRHILNEYPKYIEIYKLLAQGVVARENYQDALDLYQRVLSADPNDFVAHIGISECYQESSAPDQAIWHLERAYEQTPNNNELQNVIRQLYEDFKGTAPRKIPLSQGALARLYIKGGLFEQAISEINKVLENDPERVDLQILLADAYWQSHQTIQAGKTAAEVLKKLPYSIDANRILANLWMSLDQPEEAQPFLERVRELDPHLGYRLEQGTQDISPEAFRIPFLNYSTGQHAVDIVEADFLADIGALMAQESDAAGEQGSITDVFLEPTGQPVTAPSEGSPDWLESALSAPMAQPPALSGPEDSDLTGISAEDSRGKEPAPDWLEEVLTGASEAPLSADESPALVAVEGEAAPDWLQEVLSDAAPVLPAEEPAPDWLQDVLTAESGEPAVESLDVSDDVTADWLQDITIGEDSPAEAVTDDKAPDWLQDVLPPEAAHSGSQDFAPADVEPVAGEDMPDWLEETLAPAGPSSPTPASEPAPDWLADVLGEESPVDEAPEVTHRLDDLPEREAPDWMKEYLSDTEKVSDQLTTPVTEASVEEVSSEWLEGFLGGSDSAIETGPATESGAGTALPDWLAEPGEPVIVEQEEALPMPDLPPGELETWDDATARKHSTAESISGAKPADEAMPDWLAGAESDVAAPEPPPEDAGQDLPDWLKAAKPSEASEAEDARADEKDTIPDWLRGAAVDTEAADTDESGKVDDLPDWLKQDFD